MESLQKSSKAELSQLKISVNSITVIDCVSGVVLKDSPIKNDYILLIGKSVHKMFIAHGKLDVSQSTVEIITELIIDTYQYETPQTILLFLNKAAKGDFGKFYGSVDIGTIREWFADFLEQTICPARERKHTQNKEIYDSQREQQESLREIITGSTRLRG